MYRTLIMASFVVATTLFASAPERAHAQCITTLFNGMVAGCGSAARAKAMKLVIHRKDNSWVSYTAGVFVKSADGTFVEALSPGNNQAFSDRLVSPTIQNFNINNRDRHRIRVFTNGSVEIFNLTWNFTTSFFAGCSGNMLTGSNAAEFFSISYGPPIGNPCPI